MAVSAYLGCEYFFFGGVMENKLFREKSIKRISSPEQLNDYLHVTNPGIWALLICVIVLMAGIFTWASKASIESFVTGSGRVESGVLKVTLDQVPSGVQIETGMMINVGGKQTSVSFVGKDENGNLMAGGNIELPDGIYESRISYNRLQILSLLFN